MGMSGFREMHFLVCSLTIMNMVVFEHNTDLLNSLSFFLCHIFTARLSAFVVVHLAEVPSSRWFNNPVRSLNVFDKTTASYYTSEC